jgi:hypothetical protein
LTGSRAVAAFVSTLSRNQDPNLTSSGARLFEEK